MTEELADKKCVPCRGDVPALRGEELEKLLQSVPDWTVVNDHHLYREFRFADFRQALDFVNRVGAVAEEAGSSSRHSAGVGQSRVLRCGPTRSTG